MKTLFASVALAAMIAAPALMQTASAQTAGQHPSLDGKVEGHARTCGQDTFVYDSEGTPMGPYCH